MAGSRSPRLGVGWRLLTAACLVCGGAVGCTAPAATTTPPVPLSASASSPPSNLSIGVPRAVHTATRLRDGRVLFVGGCSDPGCEGVPQTAASVVFDPARETSEAGATLAVARLSHTATLLDDGRVLVVGGYGGEGQPPTRSIELFDPIDDSFKSAGSLLEARADHTASLLPDGRVLVAGGRGVDGSPLRSVEIIDPATSEVTRGPDLPSPRTAQVAATFEGDVMLIGGTTYGDQAVSSTLLLDLGAGRWVPGPRLVHPRVKDSAVKLRGGGILVVGGSASAESRDAYASTEVLRPRADRFRAGPRLPEGRYKLTGAAAALPDGRVAVAGGTTVVVLDIEAGTAQVVASPSLGTARAFQTLTVLPGPVVLVAGGYDASIVPTADGWLVPIR